MKSRSQPLSSRLPKLNEQYSHRYTEQINVRLQSDDISSIVQVGYDKLPTISATPLTSGCWQPSRVNAQGRNNRARYAYQRLIGSVPPDYHLHHTCPNRWCINPTHLQLLTASEHRAILHSEGQRPWGRLRRARAVLEADSASIVDPFSQGRYVRQMAAVASQIRKDREASLRGSGVSRKAV